MVPLLAKQAVETKISRKISVLVGNYEFYYALGRYARIHPELGLSENMGPRQMKEILMSSLDPQAFAPKDTEEQYLAFLLYRYRVEEDFQDEVTGGLFRWALTGE